MIRRPLVLLLVAAAVGIAAAGCGSSSSSSTASSAPASSTSASTTSTSASATTTTSGNSGSSSGSAASANPAIAQAVAACKSRINSSGNLTASLKSKLVAICDNAANGNQAGARKAAAQVCQEVIKATVPQSVQNQALAGCPTA